MFARVSLVVVTIIAICCVYTYAQFLSMACLDCICDITTGCNRTVGCNGTICGPFSITKPYWVDAGQHVPRDTKENDDDAYFKCANNFFCAVYTVQSYMFKFGRDCNGNGIVDCEDYIRLHRFGLSGCTNSLRKEYGNHTYNFDYQDAFGLCTLAYKNL